jgi:hypothetical protein
MEFPSDKPEIHTTGFETIYLEEPEDESSISSRNEELREGSFPQISSVESIDPSQFLQEEMFVEEERFVSWSFNERKLYCFNKKNLVCIAFFCKIVWLDSYRSSLTR